MNEYAKKHREYQCLDCGEIPIRNGVCPHGCPNTGEVEMDMEPYSWEDL